MVQAGSDSSDDPLSKSWPDGGTGAQQQQENPESPPLATRRTFSHYTQVSFMIAVYNTRYSVNRNFMDLESIASSSNDQDR